MTTTIPSRGETGNDTLSTVANDLEATSRYDVLPERGAAEATVGAALDEEWEEEPGFWGFITTVNHKRIGRRYLVTATFFFMLAGINALVMRTQLAQPNEHLVSPELYDQLFTLHGTAMIFFFATPFNSGFGNFFLPLMIGTRDMAYPRLNALSYWIFLFSGIFMFSSLAMQSAPDAGWFAYVPLSNEYSPQLNLDFYALGLLFLAVSSTVGAINLVVTFLKMRAPGMSLNRVPVFVWGIVAQSMMLIFALPPLDLANLMLALDRKLDMRFFDTAKGGDAVLWQHLFWLFGHPDVYIIVLPAMGIVSTIIPTFSRRSIIAYPYVVLATVATGIISFGVWVHHMFAVGLSTVSLTFFSAATLTIAVPAGIQMFAWIGTMWRGRVVLNPAMLYAMAFIITFVVGGVTGVMFAVVNFDQQVTDSYFVVAHFHYVLFGGAVFPMLGGLFYWWPKMTGRMTSHSGGVISCVLVFIGMNVTFFPMHIQGILGMPRRIYTYPAGYGWGTYNLIETIGSYILALGFLWTLFVLIQSLLSGPPAPDDPWGANTLEWATGSPPKPYNFPVIPTVHSLNPLWDGKTLATMVDHRHDPQRTMTEHHQALRTSELDGRIERVMAMPGETVQPLLVAAFLTMTVCFLLAGIWLGAVVAFCIMGLVVGWWMWNRPEIDEPAP